MHILYISFCYIYFDLESVNNHGQWRPEQTVCSPEDAATLLTIPAPSICSGLHCHHGNSTEMRSREQAKALVYTASHWSLSHVLVLIWGVIGWQWRSGLGWSGRSGAHGTVHNPYLPVCTFRHRLWRPHVLSKYHLLSGWARPLNTEASLPQGVIGLPALRTPPSAPSSYLQTTDNLCQTTALKLSHATKIHRVYIFSMLVVVLVKFRV